MAALVGGLAFAQLAAKFRMFDRFGPVGGRPRPRVDQSGILLVQPAHGGEESPLAHAARRHVESKLSPATLHPAAIDRNNSLFGLGNGSHDGRHSRLVEAQPTDLGLER
jgi:hypothetical protein